jgi:hypothetical protein
MARHIKFVFQATTTAQVLIFGENNAVWKEEFAGIPAKRPVSDLRGQ